MDILRPYSSHCPGACRATGDLYKSLAKEHVGDSDFPWAVKAPHLTFPVLSTSYSQAK